MQWNMAAMANFHAGFVLVHVNFILFVHFLPVLLANSKTVSGGIWALQNNHTKHIVI